jgi:hypothetical protein
MALKSNADLGNYVRRQVVLLTIAVSGVFHTLLLFVPTSLTVTNPPKSTTLEMKNGLGQF